MAQIMLNSAQFGCYELTLLRDEDAQFSGKEPSILIQSDWDFPGVAASFGWRACKCGATDGTVDCVHKTASEMIEEAREFLDNNENAIIDDPGYFDQVEAA